VSVVASGVRGVLHYSVHPASLVRDLNAQRLELMEGVWNRAAIKQFVVLGVSAGATTGIESWAFDGVGILAAALTINELAAHYVLINLALTCYFTLPLGISIAASIRVGHLIGQGHVKTAQLTSKLVALSGAGFMACSGLTVSLARNGIGYLFSGDAAVVAQVARIAPICGLFQTFDGIQGSTGGVLRGLGLQRWAAVINCVGLWLLGVPIGYLLCFPAGVGLPGLWWGLFIGLLAVAIGNVLLLWRVDWQAQVVAARERIELDTESYVEQREKILQEVASDVEQQQHQHQHTEAERQHVVGDYAEAIEAERRREQEEQRAQAAAEDGQRAKRTATRAPTRAASIDPL